MLFWMQWKSTVNTLFYIILKASGVPEKRGLPDCAVLLFQGCTSPEHDGAQNQTPGSQFNPCTGSHLYRSICNLLLPHPLKKPNTSFFLKSPPKLQWLDWQRTHHLTVLEDVLWRNQAFLALPLTLLIPFKNISPTGKRLMSISLERDLEV